MGNQIDFKIAR